jgi:2-oxoisovalerate dehydrogenase E1 component
MPRRLPLDPAAEWMEVVATQEDWDDASPQLLTAMFSQLVLIRTFEEYVLELAGAGLIHGPAHSSIGQEGGAVGSCMSLTTQDTVNGSHRGHHQFLAKVLGHLHPEGIDPTKPVPDDVRAALLRTLREIAGLDGGFSHGRGAACTFSGGRRCHRYERHRRGRRAACRGLGVGSSPSWNGCRRGHILRGRSRQHRRHVGDSQPRGGMEAAPVLLHREQPVCRLHPRRRGHGDPRLSARGPGFGVRSWKVDGMDPLAVHLVMQDALEHMRQGGGPTLIEADVYRYFHQNGPFAGSAFRYRSKEEEAEWRGRDPIETTRKHLMRRGILNQADLDESVSQAKALMSSLGDVLLEPKPGGKPKERQIKPKEWPDPSFVDHGVRGDLSELADLTFSDTQDYKGRLEDISFIGAVADVMDRRMTTDPRVVVMGEDVHRLNGGTNGATRGLKDKFPNRVLGTPISENAFAGLGGGVALDGRFRPVVEFMYADFMWVAADQLFNQIGKARHMFGGEGKVPFVLRSKVATGTGYGSQHSMDPAGIFATAPGWRIVAPSTPFDYVGLMNTALACDDPVVVLEHVDLYTSTGPGVPDDLDYYLPVGKAAVRRTGAKLTILTYLAMTQPVLDAVAEVGVDAEVIDLRWLDSASLDWETIEASVRKTNHVLIAEQGARGTSYGGWLSDEIGRRLFDWLDAPVERLTGGEASPSISKVLERAAFARTEEVVSKLQAMAEVHDG